mmetsp:Transcript_118193/g.294865  ORF Transcript_118193/g.294865 Transcript_118193/m.294865 type:complete len:298 (+) Transcript_118193:59-952(+)|eukprot:CAMPEP_0115207642 /NCGR_PEP_ID=MMETSP0270-20121206/20820_1 /TAXON_ID=71861 /ORGANISM="Scrippsiella trochoidea, Strain CCMP3099" /LENGTH=297 /DNA_ID=CAMNT_0002621239 /DNA_START=54 /DNA_END=947 /DNA_ORIENTATION=-
MQAVSPCAGESPRRAAMRAMKMAKPAMHPFKATWSGQLSPSHQRSSSGTLLRSSASPCAGPRKATACWRRGVAQVPADKPRARGRCLLLGMFLLVVGTSIAVRSALDSDPCSDLSDFELVSVHKHEGSGEMRVVDVPLPDFHFSAFRILAEPEFEVRRGSRPNEVKFRPRLTTAGLAGAHRTWTQGRLISSVAAPRLGRQPFSLSELPEGCHRGDTDEFAGRLVVFTAFRSTYDDDALSHVGRWWLKDGNQFDNATTGIGLALRDGYLFSDVGTDLDLVRQQLWNACGDSSRFPKVL